MKTTHLPGAHLVPTGRARRVREWTWEPALTPVCGTHRASAYSDDPTCCRCQEMVTADGPTYRKRVAMLKTFPRLRPRMM